MKEDSPNWVVLGDPATPAEAKALETFRELLPDDGVTRAWANLTFIDDNGRSAEVDVLLLTRVGFFVVELKGWHGAISGTAQRWYHAGRNVENPWLLTDRKAKRLSSLLKSYAPNPQAAKNLPWVRALVVLHGDGSKVSVEERGLSNVLKLDGYKVSAKRPLPTLREFLEKTPDHPRDQIDAVRAKVVRALCDRADFRQTPKVRMVGDFEVAESEPIAEGPDWQDVLVELPALPGVKRRLRLYDVAPKASASERSRVEDLARREFQLTYGIKHDGIAVPLDLKSTDDGPALVFEHDDAELPLGDYLAADGADLSMDDKIRLITQLGDTLRYAHQRHLIHRALSPSRVWVTPVKRGLPRLTIRDWFSGQKQRSTDATTRWTAISGGVSDLLGVANHEEWVYLAPEARQNASQVPGVPLDVYGFGALAYHVLTGSPPARSIAELEEVHAELGSLDPRRAAQGIPDDVAEAVAFATSVDESQRPETVQELLDLIRDGWDDVRRPDADAAPTPVADPLDAQKGDEIADRFLVTKRRGEGSSGVAIAVNDFASDADREVILKIARTDGAARLLRAEAQVLKGLQHKRIVRHLEGPIELDGRSGLLLSDAGAETLATKLATEGRLTLGQLERWGSELLEAMQYLDSQGVFHRDIKPANLGIREDPSTRRPALVLFDFSLATEPVENLGSGTAGYLDPYLGKGRRAVYDGAAELYAVSATLFEMATGSLPWWGNGAGVPAHPDDAAVIEQSSFERSVATQLTALFRRALAPQAKDRFSSVDELAVAWQDVFASLDIDDTEADKDEERAARATADTPLEQSGLSARAQSALARIDGVVTVGDVLGLHPVKINALRGLGEKYRKEIQARIRQWRQQLQEAQPEAPSDVSGTERVVEDLLDQLSGETRTVATTLFDLDGTIGPVASWPSPAEVGHQVGLSRDRVAHVLDDAVDAWTGGSGTVLDSIRAEALQILAENGRVMTVREVARALAAQRGSLLDGDARLRQASALLRAVYETDRRLPTPALDLRRRTSGRPPILALQDSVRTEVDDERSHPSSDVLTELATDLGRAADDLVRDGLVTRSTAVRELRGLLDEALAEAPDLSDHRLLQLASAASDHAEVSGFDELYPRDLAPVQAVEHALRGKPGRMISEAAVRRSVAARFPAVELPESSAGLDEIVLEVLPGLVNQDGVYAAPSTARHSVTGTSTALTTSSGSGSHDVARRLEESFDRRSARTLAIVPKRYTRAVHILRDGYADRGLELVDVPTLLVRSTRELAEQMKIAWPFVLDVDAAPRDSADWTRLQSLVRQALTPVWEEQMARPVPLLITNAGPLVRYGMSSMLAELLDVGTPRPAARWLLVAQSADQPVPRLEGQTVPMGPSGYQTLPSDLVALAAIAPLDLPSTSGAQQK